VVSVGILLTGLFSGPVFPLINTEVFNLMHCHREAEGSYGGYRVHGTLSWIVFTVLFGLFLQWGGRLSLVFLFFGAAYACMAAAAVTGFTNRITPVSLPISYLKKDFRFRRFLVYNFLHSPSMWE